MKPFKNLFAIILILFCSIGHQEVYSQPNTASTGETYFGVTVNGRCTGNDIMDFGSDRLEASVWEDVWGNSGFGWNMFDGINSYPGTFVLQYADAQDPDVSLVQDNNGIAHALIVYYSLSGQGYYIEEYEWDPIGITFVYNGGTYLLYAAASFGTAVNIDADWESNFIVVFDELGVLWAVTGDIYNSTLVVNNGGVIVNFGTTGMGTFPDVCIFAKTSSDRVTYCYINYDGRLHVEYDSFNDIASGINTSATNRVISSPSIGPYISPRIACPNVNSGHEDDWTTVVLESDLSSIYNVQVYNWNNAGSGLTGPLCVNDGVITGYIYNIYQCYGPVVAYNDQTTISIGWNVFDPLQNILTVDGVYPVVTICDMSAYPSAGIEFNVPAYLTSAHTMDYLSLAGRHTNNALFSTFNYQDIQDVCYKTVTGISGASSLRSQLSNSDDSEITYFKINKDKSVSGTLFDIKGQLIFQTQRLSYQDFDNDCENYLKNHPNSIYLVEIISKDGKHLFRTKLFNTK